MNKSKIPVVYIHFGDKGYLEHTLKYALKNNTDKDIILLGDSANEHYKELGIQHEYFNQFDNKPEIVRFNKNFKYIKGGIEYKSFSGDLIRMREFERFCFVRWFYLYFFMDLHDLSHCWYFDSDTLLLDSLTSHERKYISYDLTEQSNGTCMKGLISKVHLHNFIQIINELLIDEIYINRIKSELSQNKDWAFCDMRAYIEYKIRKKPNTVTLYTNINNEVFDDALLQERDSVMTYDKMLGVCLKKIFYINNELYIKNPQTDIHIKLICINLSWLPQFYITNLLNRIETGKSLVLSQLFFPVLKYRIKKILLSLKKKIINR
ncbi:MAG: hypothetical protein PHP53_03065 [Prolixibacteraceae bacterium]|nr:hypothetical protein [Prolixibacteraceae bacterium]